MSNILTQIQNGGLKIMKNESTEYELLFEKYVKDLESAIEEEKENIDVSEGDKTYRYELAISGRVIDVFRRYWFECDKLNDNEDIEEYVNPKDFVVDWLSGLHQNLYEIINSLPYYPIGIDENGDYS